MKNVITIQHTEAEHHVSGMIGGNTDWALTETGKKQAHNIGKNIKELIKTESAIIYSSDLLRARQTAEIINEYLNLKIIFREELREGNVGEAKGKSRDWYKQNCLPKENIPLNVYRAFPSAETFEDIYNRVGPIIDEIINSEYEDIIVVGHCGTLVMFLFQWLKIPVEYIENIAFEAKAGNVSFYSIWENKRMLNKWNVTSFMDNGNDA
jgi:probable phosphoglycerate mutase